MVELEASLAEEEEVPMAVVTVGVKRLDQTIHVLCGFDARGVEKTESSSVTREPAMVSTMCSELGAVSALMLQAKSQTPGSEWN